MIPALIRKCIEAKEREHNRIMAWGTGWPAREFLYVEDAAEAIPAAAERCNESDPVNLGSRMEGNIKDLMNLIAKPTGFEGETVWDTSKPNG